MLTLQRVSFAFAISLLAGAGPAITSTPGNPADMKLEAPAKTDHPFTVVGEGGAILGSQDGVFELWQNAVKVLRDFRIQVRLKDYNTTLNMNDMPATIAVSPEETVITLAHAGVVVREHLLMNRTGALPDLHAVAYFEVIPTREADVSFSFFPVLQRMWPAPNFGLPSASWRSVDNGGGYLLYTDRPGFFGAATIPGATPSPDIPYQERSVVRPAELHLHVDPVRDRGRIYPLLTTVRDGPPVDRDAENTFLRTLLAQANAVPQLKAANTEHFKKLAERTMAVHSPDKEFDQAFRWAEISIDQTRERFGDQLGLTAGWAGSGDSDRPGFGWFFGRDTLWSLYAVNSYGDFELSRRALDLLFEQQRSDGKMMHELSQTAGLVDWPSMPYLYASADSTPLLLMQMEDFVRASGDVVYLKANWQHVKAAYSFMRDHTDHGLYSNAEGSGWVEEWPSPRPHQEIYLAAVYLQACEAMQQLAAWMDDSSLSEDAHRAAQEARKQTVSFGQDGLFAFSRNADGSFDRTPTIFPSVAWWRDPGGLPDAAPQFEAWAGHDYSVDWGIRSVPATAAIYDPISYHHGSVWPLYAGWVAMAEFHAGHDLEALQRTQQLLALDRIQDLGAITEVLSGEFLEPLPRSSTHQLWSSAMAVTTAARGVLGLQPDAMNDALIVGPHLPASWNGVEVDHVRVGASSYNVTMTRSGTGLLVTAHSSAATKLCLRNAPLSGRCTQDPSTEHTLTLPLPVIEVELATSLPSEGSESEAMHVLTQKNTPTSLTLHLEAPAGSTQVLKLRRNATLPHVSVQGAELAGDVISVHFAAGSGYTSQQIIIDWGPKVSNTTMQQ